MAHQFYDYSSLYGGGTLSSSASRSFSRYLLSAAASSSSDSLSKYSMYLSQPDSAGVTAVDTTASLSSWAPPPPPPGVDVSSSVETLLTGAKRSSQALYHQTLLGAQNTIGQTEAWYSATSLAKRPRFESAYNLPIYPQRPGEKDCAHYMLTRTCKFGDSCKFDHPIWVPEGGIPDWKEVPLIDTAGQLPERPGEPDCPYFMKTQRCKYGSKCKFNHPKDRGVSEGTEATALPERPSEPPCAFYLKTGKCKFGATCKFHHPKDIQLSTVGEFDVNGEQTESVIRNEGQASMGNTSVNTPAQYINSKGLPVRPGEVDCPFYLKTGSCKYGVTCRYNHPDRNAINPPAAAMGTYAAPTAADLSVGVASPVSSLYQSIYPGLVQPLMGLRSTIYPQRPGQTECDYYMRTGECKFGERCKFHHPINRSLPMQKQAQEQSVKLTLAGLPRREGAVHCPYYMKTGTCMFGVTCKFDHPPPGEVIAQGVSTSATTEPNSG